MINKSKPFLDVIGNCAALLLQAMRRYHDAREERAQMRLAPTRLLND